MSARTRESSWLSMTAALAVALLTLSCRARDAPSGSNPVGDAGLPTRTNDAGAVTGTHHAEAEEARRRASAAYRNEDWDECLRLVALADSFESNDYDGRLRAQCTANRAHESMGLSSSRALPLKPPPP